MTKIILDRILVLLMFIWIPSMLLSVKFHRNKWGDIFEVITGIALSLYIISVLIWSYLVVVNIF